MMPACFVEEEGVFRLRDVERAGIERAGAVEQRGRARSADLEQLHVRDVEQAGMLAGVQMLLHDAGRIGQRHRPAGEGAKTRAGGDVQIFEGKVFGVVARHCFSRAHAIRPLMATSPCPSV